MVIKNSGYDSAFIKSDGSGGKFRCIRIMRNKDNGSSFLMIIFYKRHQDVAVDRIEIAGWFISKVKDQDPG